MEKRYNTNHSIVYDCQYHVIFCPKYRRHVLVNGINTRFIELIYERQLTYGYSILEMEVMPEHIHLLLCVNPQIGINNVVGKIKGYTSYQLRREFPKMKKLPNLWTRSKFISTVGAVTLDVVKKYIEGQTDNGNT